MDKTILEKVVEKRAKELKKFRKNSQTSKGEDGRLLNKPFDSSTNN